MPTTFASFASFASLATLATLAATASGCTDDLTLPWELAHERVIAVRATPPAIEPGQRASIDALLVQQGGTTLVASPEGAAVVSPASLADLLSREREAWIVTAPDPARLAAARTELALAADAPVPLVVRLTFAAPLLPATKTVWLGASAAHPPIEALTIDHTAIESGADPGAELTVVRNADLRLAIFAEPTDDVTWLTSTGTLQDFDLPSSYLRLDDDDPATGELVVVRRDARGGVAWQRRPLRVQ